MLREGAKVPFLLLIIAMHNDLHEKYKHEALLELGSRFDTRCWPNEVGAAHALSDQSKPQYVRRMIRYGVRGSADILGFTRICEVPIFFGVEVKSGKAVQQKNQKNWEKMLRHFNGIYIIYRGDIKKLKQDFENARNRCRSIICQNRV